MHRFLVSNTNSGCFQAVQKTVSSILVDARRSRAWTGCWISDLRRKFCFSTCLFLTELVSFWGLHVKLLSDDFKSCWYIWALEVGGSMIRRWEFLGVIIRDALRTSACVPYEWGPCPFMEPKLQRQRVLGSVSGCCNMCSRNEETPQEKQKWVIHGHSMFNG